MNLPKGKNIWNHTYSEKNYGENKSINYEGLNPKAKSKSKIVVFNYVAWTGLFIFGIYSVVQVYLQFNF